jgi:predicted mannosyl-3-phosphoglycerate phosphatase (HAD superfamily)
LGADYSTVRHKLAFVRMKNKANICGFGDMSIKEVANDAGLTINLAILAKKREYDEPFKIIKGCEEDILRSIEDAGLCYTKGGRYFHIFGNTNKGKALAILKQLYLREFRKIVTIGIGDGLNDLPMFELVNKPFKINDKMTYLSAWQEILELV